MGGFIGNDESKHDWLRYRTLNWDKNINAITKMAGKYPQECCPSVVCTIQLEWIFFKRVTKDTGYMFAGVEKLLWVKMLPRLFFRKLKPLPPIVGTLSTIPVNKSDLGLQYLVTSANQKYLGLLCASIELIGAVTRVSNFSTTGHLLALRGERRDNFFVMTPTTPNSRD